MAAALHVRKHKHHGGGMDTIMESSSSSMMTPATMTAAPFLQDAEASIMRTPNQVVSSPTTKGHKKSKERKKQEELRYALFIVLGFVLFGLGMGYFLLQHQHRTVILHVLKNPWVHGRAILRGRHNRHGFRHHFYSGQPRFVTVVMPSVVNPKGRWKRLESIQATWGPAARALYVVHNVSAEFPAAIAAQAVVSETSQPHDPYAFPQVLVVPPRITEEHGVQRLFYTIQSIHQKVNPDFAFFVNDHTYVIPEHLCKYLKHKNPTQDVYEGHALRNAENQLFNSGAAGYVLSRAAMEKIVKKYNDKDEDCWIGPNAKKWLQNNPGLVTLKCLNAVGIHAVDTRALKKWHRFHAFPLTRVVMGQVDEWYKKKHLEVHEVNQNFDASYESLLSGEDCCSKSTISFHYVEYLESRALFAVRKALLAKPHMADSDLKALVTKEWPDKNSVGAYSRGLPSTADAQAWKDLLAVLRKISLKETQREC